MGKPIIGVLARSFMDENDPCLGMQEAYRFAILEAGGIPILISPTNLVIYQDQKEKESSRLTLGERYDFYQLLSLCDGFLSPGGCEFYDYDCIVCRYAFENDLPYLGICLGMQILGGFDSYLKGVLIDQTILNDTDIEHYQPKNLSVHKNKILSSKLLEIFETKELTVNSRHHYHIEEKPFFRVSSRSMDGLIEGIEIPNKKFMIGVQWHPESMISDCKEMLKLFKAFVEACNS